MGSSHFSMYLTSRSARKLSIFSMSA
jgi:hypothetical protein